MLYKIYAAEDKSKLPEKFRTDDKIEWWCAEAEMSGRIADIAEETRREIFEYQKKRYKKPFGAHRIETGLQKYRQEGKITDEECLLYTAYALYDRALLPSKYKKPELYQDFERRGYIYPDAPPKMHDMYYDGAEKNFKNRIEQEWFNLSQGLRAKLEPLLKKNNVFIPQRVEKGPTTLGLIEEAYQKGEIDDDAATLYKFYDYYGLVDLIPKNLIGNPLQWESDVVFEPPPFIEQKWNKLRQETKIKMKKARWGRNLHPESISINLPRDNEVVNLPAITVKGAIKTLEMYEVIKAWIEVGDKKQEINISKSEYIPPEETFEDTKEGRLSKQRYFEWKEKHKDNPGFVELSVPPGQKVYKFSETVVLPSTGIHSMKVYAQNASDGSANKGVYVVYPPKDKTDTTPPTIEIEGIYEGQILSEKDFRYKVRGYDENLTLWFIYLNDKKLTGGSPLPWIDISAGAGPAAPGKNIFRVVATDLYGNKNQKEIKFIYKK
ncbi:MAG: hypothetical protein CVU77_06490 [Elusimicrobia bacterium HGW-Elusimicrobia-1]|nr:MAG: hypothetical protein CVU77_06490 [Elusimicrobia bacterium HGW-Elusimicrobia-1]